MSTKESPGEGMARWWEFYAVRYAMGTVIGAIICYFVFADIPVLKHLLLVTHTQVNGTNTERLVSVENMDAAHLWLFGALGLVYCYIASAPILVFHAGRFLLKPLPRMRWVLPASLPAAAGILFLLPVLLAISVPYAVPHSPSKTVMTGAVLFFIAGLFCLAITVAQYLVAGQTIVQSSALFDFYRNLAAKRRIAKGGITDSYRHLREHGNSFFIVFLELLLGIVLIGVNVLWRDADPKATGIDLGLVADIAILLIWITPAVFVWLIGTQFEREFADQYPQTAKPANDAATRNTPTPKSPALKKRSKSSGGSP